MQQSLSQPISSSPQSSVLLQCGRAGFLCSAPHLLLFSSVAGRDLTELLSNAFWRQLCLPSLCKGSQGL